MVDPLAEMYSSYSPYAYVGNDPILFHDPNGMYRIDANGNITIDDPYEISNFFNYLDNNSGASVNDMFNHIKADNGFFWELDPITVTGSRSSFEQGHWLGDFWGRVGEAQGQLGSIHSVNIGQQQNRDMQTALNGLDFAGNIGNLTSGLLEGATYKHFLGTIRPSQAYGVNVYAKSILNGVRASPWVRGNTYVGFSISTATIGTTWAEEGSFGQQTKIATAKAATGWAGAWAGGKVGATAFGLGGGVIAGPPGAAIGAIVGGGSWRNWRRSRGSLDR